MQNTENDLQVFYARALQNALSLSQAVRLGVTDWERDKAKIDDHAHKKRASGNSLKRTDANVHI